MARAKNVDMPADDLALQLEQANKKIASLQAENAELRTILQGFEDFTDKVALFLLNLEQVVPPKLTGWWRWLIMGFATMKAVIDLVQEFAAQLEAWKNRTPKPSTSAKITYLETGIRAAQSIPAKV